MKIFGVRDSKANAYVQYIPVKTTAMALRSFETAANNPEHEFCKYAEDFSLFELGEANDVSGDLTPCPQPINLGLAAEFKREQE